MKDNLLEQARNIKIESILNYYGRTCNKYGFYSCLKHIDKHPSARINKETNKLKCFSCGSVFSGIDIVQELEQISSLRDCAKKVLDISGEKAIPVINDKKGSISTKSKNINKITIQDKKNMLDVSQNGKLINYLQSRNINITALDILKKNGYIYGVDKLGQVTFIFEKYNCCIYRHSETNRNWCCGSNTPVTILVNKNDKEWYIVEGLFDALTLVGRGKNAICLNSISNIDELIDLIKGKTDFTYIIAVDNDIQGLEGRTKLEKSFIDSKLKFKIFEDLYKSECKDVNDMAKNNILNL